MAGFGFRGFGLSFGFGDYGGLGLLLVLVCWLFVVVARFLTFGFLVFRCGFFCVARIVGCMVGCLVVLRVTSGGWLAVGFGFACGFGCGFTGGVWVV